MGSNSKIEWTRHTFNAWVGCSKVSAGCTRCYAESLAKRTGLAIWGDSGTRHVTSDAYWQEPYKWATAASMFGERHRVFCNSLADVFEDRPDLSAPRHRLWRLILDTRHSLDWLLLTKRPENFNMIPLSLADSVWLGVSVEDQATADERIPLLLKTPAAVRFVSCEPLISPVDVSQYIRGYKPYEGSGAIIFSADADRCLFDGGGRPDMETSQASGGEPRRNTSSVEGHRESSGGKVNEQRIPHDLLQRRSGREAKEGVGAPNRLDDSEQIGYCAGPGNQPQGRHTEEHIALEPGNSNPLTEHDSRLSGAGEEREVRIRRDQSGGPIAGERCLTNQGACGQDTAVADGCYVPHEPGDNFSGHNEEVMGASGISLIIVGCESGPGARPMDENWVRSIRDQCVDTDVPFFYKQRLENGHKVSLPLLDGQQWAQFPEAPDAKEGEEVSE